MVNMAEQTDGAPNAKRLMLDNGNNGGNGERSATNLAGNGSLGGGGGGGEQSSIIPRGMIAPDIRCYNTKKTRRLFWDSGTISIALNTTKRQTTVTYDWHILPNNNLQWYLTPSDYSRIFTPGATAWRVKKLSITGRAPRITLTQPFSASELVVCDKPYFMNYIDYQGILFNQETQSAINPTIIENASPNQIQFPPEFALSNTAYQGMSTPTALYEYKHWIYGTQSSQVVNYPGSVQAPFFTVGAAQVDNLTLKEALIDIDSVGPIRIMDSTQEFYWEKTFQGDWTEIMGIFDNIGEGASEEAISYDRVEVGGGQLYNPISRWGQYDSSFKQYFKDIDIETILFKVPISYSSSNKPVVARVDMIFEYGIEVEVMYSGTTSAKSYDTIINGRYAPNVNAFEYYKNRGKNIRKGYIKDKLAAPIK